MDNPRIQSGIPAGSLGSTLGQSEKERRDDPRVQSGKPPCFYFSTRGQSRTERGTVHKCNREHLLVLKADHTPQRL